MTQRDGMGREVEGGFRMGNTCTPVVDSCWCTAKPIQYCNVKEINKSKKKKKKEMPMALLSDCLGAVRAAWVCWGPNLCSFCFFSLCVYFPISSLLWSISVSKVKLKNESYQNPFPFLLFYFLSLCGTLPFLTPKEINCSDQDSISFGTSNDSIFDL